MRAAHPLDQPINSARARTARAGRSPDPNTYIQAKRELKTLIVERAIRQAVEEAPRLTGAQRDHLAELLRPTDRCSR